MSLHVIKIADENIRNYFLSFNLENFVPFVGAGISFDSGLPLQNDLKEQILKNLCESDDFLMSMFNSMKETWIKRSEQVMLESIMQVISQHFPEFVENIAPIFLKGIPSEYHYLIAQLLAQRKIQYVITTNFDNLIEKAYQQIQNIYNNENIPRLSILMDSGDISKKTTIIKLHGCATNPMTMAFTLTRVGKGLNDWQRNTLMELSKTNSFVFVGYSDRDKDITPALDSLTNDWLWMFYKRIPISSDSQKMTNLEKLLLKTNRRSIQINPLLGFRELCKKYNIEYDLIFNILKKQMISKSDWRSQISLVISKISLYQRIEILGDLLREQLSEPLVSERIYTYLLKKNDLEVNKRVYIMLKLTAVYGEQWRMDLVEKNMDEITKLINENPIKENLLGLYFRNRGNLYHQKAIQYSEDAIKSYTKSEEYFMRTHDKFNEAWTIQNKAVTLLKMANINEAMPLFEKSIKIFRELGELEKVAMSLINFGSLLNGLGRKNDAIKSYEEALEIFFMLGNEHWVARCKCNLADGYEEIGDKNKAKELALEAKEILERIGDIHWIEQVNKLLKLLDNK